MLNIKKYGNKNFQHESENYQDYGANDITIIFEGNTVRLRSLSGRVIFDRVGYPLNEVSVYDVGGSAETFPSIEALKQRLINLGYPFNGGSDEIVLNSVDWGNINGDINNQVDLVNELNGKQDTLVSGTNIKTINGNSLLGGGNLEIDSASDFTSLTDTPNDYTGQGGKIVKVNVAENALEFDDESEGIPSGGNTGQVLTKQSNTDYDADWEDVPPTTLQEAIAADDTATTKPLFQGQISVGDGSEAIVEFYAGGGGSIEDDGGALTVNHDSEIGLTANGIAKNATTIVDIREDWNADTNTPALANTDTGQKNIARRVSVAGSHDFGAGSIDFEVDDYIINDGTVWRKFINNNQSAGGVSPIQTVVKLADENRVNTNVVTADSELTGALEANSIYNVELFAIYKSQGTPDFKSNFTIPTGATGKRVYNSAAPSEPTLDWDEVKVDLGYGSSTQRVITHFGTIITTNAGNLTFNWSQNVADASATTVFAGSMLKIIKLI